MQWLVIVERVMFEFNHVACWPDPPHRIVVVMDAVRGIRPACHVIGLEHDPVVPRLVQTLAVGHVQASKVGAASCDSEKVLRFETVAASYIET